MLNIQSGPFRQQKRRSAKIQCTNSLFGLSFNAERVCLFKVCAWVDHPTSGIFGDIIKYTSNQANWAIN